MHPHTWQIQDQASLGVDTHFTFSTDMIGQARLWLQTLRGIEYRQALDDLVIPRNNPMSVEQAFLLITRNGALALRRPDIGMIKEGAKADLIVFDTDAPNMLGWDDPIAAIILHSNVGDIRDVMVDGKFVKRDRRLTFDNYANLRRDFLASAERIQGIWNERQWESLQGLYEGVTPYGDADQIDVQRGPGTGY